MYATNKMLPKITTCRICLKPQCPNRVSFDEHSEWMEIFKFCVGISIKVEENAPKVFCGDCATLLQKYSEFKKLCLRNNDVWEKFGIKLEDNQSIKELEDVLVIQVKKEEDDFEDEYNSSEYASGDDFEAKEYNTKINKKHNIENSSQDIVKDFKSDNRSNELDEIEQVTDGDNTENNENIQQSKEITLKRLKRSKKLKLTKEKDESNEENFIHTYFQILYKNKRASYLCLKCGKTIGNRRPLKQHLKICKLKKIAIKEKPPAANEFYCGICDFKSEKETVVNKHFNQHCARNDLNCSLCDYVGLDAAHMVSHRIKHYPQGFAHKTACPECTLRTPRNSAIMLEYHYRSVHLKKPGGLCPVCKKEMHSKRNFKVHLRTAHDTERFVCDYCKQIFKTRKSILGHMRVTHIHPRRFMCQHCGKIFKKISNLHSHVLNIHTKTKRITCKDCGKTFKGDHNLRKHRLVAHSEKNYICDRCPKRFPTANHLKLHEIWHTDEKPFKCETCSKAYKTNSQLTVHKRSHTGILPFVCPICSKQFASSSSLNRHNSVHTGIRAVKCLYCDQTFHLRKSMFEHVKKRHK